MKGVPAIKDLNIRILVETSRTMLKFRQIGICDINASLLHNALSMASYFTSVKTNTMPEKNISVLFRKKRKIKIGQSHRLKEKNALKI